MTTRPSKPSARSVSAALAPARLAPTITNVWSCEWSRVMLLLASPARDLLPRRPESIGQSLAPPRPSSMGSTVHLDGVRCPWRHVVLSGGAGLGAVQVGLLRALYEHGISPDVIVGTSAGALNGAFIAALAGRRRPRELRRAGASSSLLHG